VVRHLVCTQLIEHGFAGAFDIGLLHPVEANVTNTAHSPEERAVDGESSSRPRPF
jgi:hypothetical protein